MMTAFVFICTAFVAAARAFSSPVLNSSAMSRIRKDNLEAQLAFWANVIDVIQYTTLTVLLVFMAVGFWKLGFWLGLLNFLLAAVAGLAGKIAGFYWVLASFDGEQDT